MLNSHRVFREIFDGRIQNAGLDRQDYGDGEQKASPAIATPRAMRHSR